MRNYDNAIKHEKYGNLGYLIQKNKIAQQEGLNVEVRKPSS